MIYFSKPHYSGLSASIYLEKESIVNTLADAIVIPVSTAGTISEAFEHVLSSFSTKAPQLQKSHLGDITAAGMVRTKDIVQKTARLVYATSVDDISSSYLAIRTIGRRLAEFAYDTKIKSIAAPILGSGAGGLDSITAFYILAMAFYEASCGKTSCHLNVFAYDETYAMLYGTTLPERSSQQLVFMTTIQQQASFKWLREIAESKTFYFEIARQKLHDYLNYRPASTSPNIFYEQILMIFKGQTTSFEELLNNYGPESREYQLLLLLGKLVAHIDSNAYNKNIWNEYPDKRTMARANVRQHHWVENLLLYKINGDLDAIAGSVANAIRYLQNPEFELTMLSENHRKQVMEMLFEKPYAGGDDLRRLFDLFAQYVHTVNPLNRGHLYSRLLYVNDIHALWSRQIPAAVEEMSSGEEANTPAAAAKAKSNGYSREKIMPVIHSDLFAQEDLLNYEIYAHAIVAFLKHKNTRPPLTIGIMAPWGKGKTTMMRFVQKKLDEYEAPATEEAAPKTHETVEVDEQMVVESEASYKDILHWLRDNIKITVARLKNPTVWFNAWKCQKSEEIWAGFAHEIIQQLVSKLPDEIEREKFWLTLNRKRIDQNKIRNQITFSLINKVVAHTWWLLMLSIAAASIICIVLLHSVRWGSALFGGTFLSWIGWGWHLYSKFSRQKLDFDISKYVRQPNYEEKRGYFHQVETDLRYVLEILVSKEDPVVIFIDDLDRCSPKVVAEVVEAINLFISGDFPHCYFILGQDAQMVAAALDAAYKDVDAKVTNIQRGHGSLGWYFMEKFIQLQLNIPNITSGQSQAFLKALFKQPADISSANAKEAKKRALEEYREISSNIKAVGDKENFRSFEPAIAELEKALPVEAQSLRELIITTAAESFNDDDTEVLSMIEAYSKYLGSSPRLIKRFVNLYRFYRFMQFTGQSPTLDEIDSNVLGRWIIFTIRWPQLIRCIQWDTEKDFMSGSSPEEKASIFEKQLLEFSEYSKWKEHVSKVYTSSIPWLSDESLYYFIQNTKGEACSLSKGVQVGFW